MHRSQLAARADLEYGATAEVTARHSITAAGWCPTVEVSVSALDECSTRGITNGLVETCESGEGLRGGGGRRQAQCNDEAERYGLRLHGFLPGHNPGRVAAETIHHV